MVHRGVLIREQLEQPDPFALAVILEGDAKDVLRSPIVSPVAEDKACTAFRRFDAPTGKDAGDFDDVLLGVAAVDAQRVELEELARIVLVDSRGQPTPLLRHLVHAEPSPEESTARGRRCRTRCHTLCIVEVEQHRGTFGSRDEQILEAPE